KKPPVPFFLLVALLTAGCDSSPAEPFARLLEHAASWAAAARYAAQLNTRHEVPDAYLEDLIKTGRNELPQLRTKIAKSKEISPDTRAAALILTDELQAL